jgi:hypothetical protein
MFLIADDESISTAYASVARDRDGLTLGAPRLDCRPVGALGCATPSNCRQRCALARNCLAEDAVLREPVRS